MLPVMLISNSPRRWKLIKQVVTDFQILKPDFPEILTSDDNPHDFVRKNAVGKNLSAPKCDLPLSYCLISSDTIVVWNNTILGKPVDQEEAVRFLRSISGTRHEVLTGVSIRIFEKENQVHRYFYDLTTLLFQPLSDASIQKYVHTKNPLDKAGAYGIQEIPSDWVQEIQGDLDNVVGLPVKQLKKELIWLSRYFELPILQL